MMVGALGVILGTMLLAPEERLPDHEADVRWPVDDQPVVGTVNRYALIVGNSQYLHQETFPGLSFIREDVKALRSRLTQLGFPAEHISVMQDKEVNRGRIKVEVEELKLRISNDRENIVLVWWGGHGERNNNNEIAYPIYQTDKHPVAEAKLGEDLEDAIMGFDLASLLSPLTDHPTTTVLLVSDTCQTQTDLGAREARDVKKLTLGDITVFGTKPGFPGYPNEDRSHSLFCDSWLKVIDAWASGNDPVLTVRRLTDRVREMTTRHRDYQQEPVLDGPEALKDLELFSRRDLSFRVRVFDANNREAIAARVGLVKGASEQEETGKEVVFHGLLPATYRLKVEAEGYFVAYHDLRLNLTNSGRTCDLMLKPEYVVLRGKVRDREGTPQEHRRVTALGLSGREGYHVHSNHTDENGEVTLILPREASYDLSVAGQMNSLNWEILKGQASSSGVPETKLFPDIRLNTTEVSLPLPSPSDATRHLIVSVRDRFEKRDFHGAIEALQVVKERGGDESRVGECIAFLKSEWADELSEQIGKVAKADTGKRLAMFQGAYLLDRDFLNREFWQYEIDAAMEFMKTEESLRQAEAWWEDKVSKDADLAQLCDQYVLVHSAHQRFYSVPSEEPLLQRVGKVTELKAGMEKALEDRLGRLRAGTRNGSVQVIEALAAFPSQMRPASSPPLIQKVVDQRASLAKALTEYSKKTLAQAKRTLKTQPGQAAKDPELDDARKEWLQFLGELTAKGENLADTINVNAVLFDAKSQGSSAFSGVIREAAEGADDSARHAIRRMTSIEEIFIVASKLDRSRSSAGRSWIEGLDRSLRTAGAKIVKRAAEEGDGLDRVYGDLDEHSDLVKKTSSAWSEEIENWYQLIDVSILKQFEAADDLFFQKSYGLALEKYRGLSIPSGSACHLLRSFRIEQVKLRTLDQLDKVGQHRSLCTSLKSLTSKLGRGQLDSRGYNLRAWCMFSHGDALIRLVERYRKDFQKERRKRKPSRSTLNSIKKKMQGAYDDAADVMLDLKSLYPSENGPEFNFAQELERLYRGAKTS